MNMSCNSFMQFDRLDNSIQLDRDPGFYPIVMQSGEMRVAEWTGKEWYLCAAANAFKHFPDPAFFSQVLRERDIRGIGKIS